MEHEPLIPKHGGYHKLKTFQLAELIYDVTVRFCNRYIDRRSRTHDQMVQAARSGVQNIAEGSQASGTSKKTELKLTNVARASLVELHRDYEDYLRQHGLPVWAKDDPRRQNLIDRRPATADDVAQWAKDIRESGPPGPHGQKNPRTHNRSTMSTVSTMSTMSTGSTGSTAPAPPPSFAEIAANGALALISVAVALLGRQLEAQAHTFEQEGGFTERLHRVRTARRNRP